MSLILIALAVSLDSCSVGLLYGARKIRIPWVSILIISICSGAVIWGSMSLGLVMMEWLEPEMAKAVGALILVLVGVWAVFQFFLHHRKPNVLDHTAERIVIKNMELPIQTVLHIEIRKIGLVIQILRSPTVADIDQSGNISPWEASLLGIALSLDALGAGIGAALIGYSPLSTALWIAFSGGLFITIGLRLGRWLSSRRWMQRLSILPGLLLITLGIMKLL
ncbi:MAG: sporulation membrane protein YtaF [Paenibacillaceae bacterium]